MSCNINNRLFFIDSFQSLSSFLGNLVKNLGKDDLSYLSQEFDTCIFDLENKNDFILLNI